MTGITRFFHQLGVSLDVAKNEDEAIEMFKKKKYHLIFIGKARVVSDFKAR
jgi:hypothetical protein